MIYLLNSALGLLAFIPGIFFLFALRIKYFRNYSKSEMILGGLILWSYLLIIPSISIGLLSSNLTSYFDLFFYASIVTSLISIVVIARRFALSLLKHIQSFRGKSFDINVAVVVSFVALLSLIIFIENLYTPIIWNWDGISVYLPIAKGINTTGSLSYNAYFPATSKIIMAYPIAIPVLYAWIMRVAGGYFRFIPLIYLFITVLSVYEISKLLFRNKLHSYMVVAALLSIPGLLALTQMDGLSLDLPFIAYSTSAMFFIISGIAKKDQTQILLGALSSSLSMLTKGPGVIIIPPLLAFMLLGIHMKSKLIKSILLTVVVISPFLFQYVIYVIPPIFTGTYLSPNVAQTFLYFIIFKGAVILLIAALLFLIIKSIEAVNFGFSMKNILLLLLFITMGTTTFIHNILNVKMITVELPLFSLPQFKDPVLVSIFYPDSNNVDSYYSAFQFQGVFASGLVTAPFAPLLVAGILSIAYKIKKQKNALFGAILIYFLLLLLLWAFNFNSSFELWEYRRIVYFAPLLSIFIVDGFMAIFKTVKLNSKFLVWSFVVYITLTLLYIWHFKVGLVHYNKAIFIPRLSVANISDILSFTSFLLFTLLIVDFIDKRLKFKIQVQLKGIHKGIHISRQKLALLTILVNFGFLLSIPCSALLQISNMNPSYYDSLASVMHQDQMLANDYTDIVEYFCHNQRNFSQSIILTFGASFLPYTSNMTIIACEDIFSYEYLQPLLQTNDPIELKNMLEQRNINYFLLPKSNIVNSGYYNLYHSLSNHYLLFQMIASEPFSEVVKDFHSYTLWRLSPQKLSRFTYVDAFEKERISPNWTIWSGDWLIQNGALVQNSLESTGVIITSTSLIDYTLEVDMRTIARNYDYSYNVGWISFNYIDSQNYAYILLHSNGNLELHSVKNGTLSPPYEVIQTKLNISDWHKYTIVVRGQSIQVYVDDVKYFDVIDNTPLYPGQFALMTINSKVVFDNFKVTGISIIPD